MRVRILALVAGYFALTWTGTSLAQPVIDGTLSPGEYGAALSIQNTDTHFGDALNGDPAVAVSGSEIDQVFGTILGGRLYVLIAGNLESNFNELEVFIDSVPGGVNQIDSASLPSGVDPYSGGALERMHGLTFDAGFEADRYLTFINGFESVAAGSFWALTAHSANLTGGPGGHVSTSGMQLHPFGLEPGLAQGELVDQLNNGCAGPSYPSCSPPSHDFAESNYRNMLNDVGLLMAIDNRNTIGVVAGTGPTIGNPQDVVTGVEFSLPLSQLGNPTGAIKITAFINGGRHGYASNQFAGVGVLQSNFGPPSTVDLAAIDGEQFVVLVTGPAAPFNIFQWEYVDPQDPSQGKQESNVFTVDGYGLHAQPGLIASNKNLAMAYLVGADLTGASFVNANLTDAQLDQANLTNTDFNGANYTGADFNGADVRGARLNGVTVNDYGWVCHRPMAAGCLGYTFEVVSTHNEGGINLPQLNTTASYLAHDLSGIDLAKTNLVGANFAGYNLTQAKLSGAYVESVNLTNANLTHANLTNASFYNSTFAGADLSGADARGAHYFNPDGATVRNLIQVDGHVSGLELAAGEMIVVRNYDGGPFFFGFNPFPITVDDHLTIATSGVLRMVFDADAWGSTISFAVSIPVALDGTLELLFADGIDPTSQVGRTFDLFNWTGVVPTGVFTVGGPYIWNVSNLYTNGEVTLTGVPEPAALALLMFAATGWCLRRGRASEKVQSSR